MPVGPILERAPRSPSNGMGKTMLGRRWCKTLHAFGFTLFLMGCDDGSRTPISPSTPTPTPIPGARPTLPDAIADSVLSGVVFEVSSTGRIPLAGVTLHLLTCGAVNCPPSSTAAHEVKTGENGGYRIAGVYNGALNFFWIRNEVYDLVNPVVPGTCPDGCDRVVTVNGDTRLDIDLVRR